MLDEKNNELETNPVEDNLEEDNLEEEKSFEELLNEHGDFEDLDDHTIRMAKIISITKEEVTVDVGYKTEGRISIDEFTKEEMKTLKEGSEVEIYVIQVEDRNGNLKVSRRQAKFKKIWDDLFDAMKKKVPVKATVTKKVERGFLAQVGPVEAFVPFSIMDIIRRNPEYYLNNEFEFLVDRANKKRKNVVLNRRTLLESLRMKRVEEIMTSEPGAIMKGTVTRIREFGVFVDIGNIEGMVHIGDISWGKIKHPGEVFNEGDNIEVVFLGYKEKDRKIKLGYKQLTQNPWDLVNEKYTLGEIVDGTIRNITDFGLFVALEPGLEGLVHRNDLMWSSTEKINIKKDYQVDESIKIRILNIDSKNRKLKLSAKHLTPDPWLTVEERFEVDDRVKGTVTSIQPYGVFVQVEPGIEGLIHVNELTWSSRIRDPKKIVKKGELIEAEVITLDKENRKIGLSMKAVLPNPWEEAEQKYHAGAIYEGLVRNVEQYGAFIELLPGVEGLLHISDFYWNSRVQDARDEVKPGDMIKVKILDLDPEERRLKLGMKQVTTDPWFDIEKRYAVGDIFEGTISKIIKPGLIISLENDVDAFLHLNDISWDRNFVNLQEQYKEEDPIRVKILKCDSSNRKIQVGLKQLSEDPWVSFERKHPKNSIVTCVVKKLLDNGLIVNVDVDIDGYIHKNQLSKKRIENPSELFKEGDETEAAIIEIEPSKRVLKLSIVKSKDLKERREYEKYKDEVTGVENVTLGDMFGNVFDALQSEVDENEKAKNE